MAKIRLVLVARKGRSIGIRAAVGFYAPARRLIVALIGVCLGAAGAFAQEQALVLEEVIVTVQKRPESLEEVPVSVNVTFGERLNETAISNVEDLDEYVPNLVMSETAIGTNVFIRGIGSGVNTAFEQSVGTYVDGIYQGRAQLFRVPFFDLARIEVLRGPQSTLFGKNSIAGALNLVARQPDDAFEAEVISRYEPEFSESELIGVISGPIGDRIRGRIAVRGSQSDGHVFNNLLSRDEPQRDETAVRAILDWGFSENGAANLIAETSSFDLVGRQIEIVQDSPAVFGPFAGLNYGQILAGIFGQPPSVLENAQNYQRGSNGDFSRNDSERLTLTLNWEFDNWALTSVTGHSAYDFQELCDCDFTAANVFTAGKKEDFDQFSQELRLTSATDGAFEYIVGIYFQEGELKYSDYAEIDAGSVLVPLVNGDPTIPMPPFPPMPGTLLIADTAAPRIFNQDTDIVALFGHATWKISDRLRLSFGGRYTSEDKSGLRQLMFSNADRTPLNPLTAPLTTALYNSLFNMTPHVLSGERKKDRFMPSAAFEWDVSGNTLAYVSVSKGFKSGGFDARSNNPPVNPLFPASVGSFEFADEEARNVEVGVKTAFGRGRGEILATLYDTNYDDLQVSTFDGTFGFNVGNAGAAKVKGLEIETRYRVSQNVLLSGGIGLTDFIYEEFFGQCYFGRAPDAPDGINCNYRGNTNQYVADWSGVLSADWTFPLNGNLDFRWVIDALFTDDYFLSPTLHPSAVQEGFTKFNTRLSIGPTSGSWELALIGKNLTDKVSYPYSNETPLAGSIFGAPGFFAFVDPPRSVALQGIVRFD